MAQLIQPQNSGFSVDELPPAGTFCAVVLDIIDLFGVQRPKFENPAEKETLDVTRFLFGFQGQDGRFYKIQTREMRISGNSKSKLFQFLTGMLGHPPRYGWDYCELRGRPAMITVMHQQGRKDPTKMYAGIASVAPLPHQLQHAVPPIAAFNYVREAQQQGNPPSGQFQQVPRRGLAPAPVAPQQVYPAQLPQPQPPPTPQQYPLQVPMGQPTPAQGATQPSAPPAMPAQVPPLAVPQQAPKGLWNPETDDPNEIPF